MSRMVSDKDGEKSLRRTEAIKVLERRLGFLLKRSREGAYSANSFGYLRMEIQSLRWVIKLAKRDVANGGFDPKIDDL